MNNNIIDNQNGYLIPGNPVYDSCKNFFVCKESIRKKMRFRVIYFYLSTLSMRIKFWIIENSSKRPTDRF